MDYRQPGSPELVVAAFAGHVIAYDPATGKHVWEDDDSWGLVLRVAIHHGRVYLLGAELRCLDYPTGTLLWRKPLPESVQTGTLLVTAHHVLIAGQGEVCCYDAENGQRLWHDPLKGKGLGPVALALPGHTEQADRY